MIGSNSTALRQHAYSVFTASRRERESRNDIPESVLNHMAAGSSQPMPTRLPASRIDRSTEPKPAEPERAAVVGRGGVIEALTPGARLVAQSKLASADVVKAEPTQEDVRRRAYDIFLARHGEPGDPVADWLRAEAELRRERGLA